MTWWQWLLTAAGITFAVYLALVAVLVLAGRRQDARALAGFIPDCIVLFSRLLGDDRVARRHKLLLGALIGYLAMPIDLIPDFIPVAGQLDDAIIVAVVLRTVLAPAGPSCCANTGPAPPPHSPRSRVSPTARTRQQHQTDAQHHPPTLDLDRPTRAARAASVAFRAER